MKFVMPDRRIKEQIEFPFLLKSFIYKKQKPARCGQLTNQGYIIVYNIHC